MSILSLSQTFRRLVVSGQNVCRHKYHTIKCMEPMEKLAFLSQSTDFNKEQLTSVKDSLITFSPRAINVDLDLPTSGSSIRNIVDFPISIKNEIGNPLKFIIERVDITPDKSVDLPTFGNAAPKSAANVSIIKIRRKKIKKHKRRKLRKRRTAELLKTNKRRGVKREKLFQAELWAKVKEAENFNAEAYVKSRIELFTQKKIPPIYKGYLLPVEVIKELKEKERLRKERYKIKKRLTL